MFTKPLKHLLAELSSIVKNYISTGLMRVHGDWMMLVQVCCMLVITFSCFFIAVFSCRWRLHPLSFDAACRTRLFVGFLCPYCKGNRERWILLLDTHFCQWTHFFYEGDNVMETFKSVDVEVIVSRFNKPRNHVLYWYMSFNDPVLYWWQLELPSSGRVST